MKYGSLFTGAGGFDLGFDRAGMTCAWQVEINPYRRRVLAQHWPDITRFGDIREVGRHNLETVDLICGGYPCQDNSTAGSRAGLDGARSGLWTEFARVIRDLRPRWVVVENVRGLLSVNAGRDFGIILGDLAECGYDAEWEVLPASAFGAIHRRNRVVLLAYAQGTRLAQRGSVLRSCEAAFAAAESVASDARPATLADSEYLSEARNWPRESVFLRKDHGLSHRVDRIEMIGDAVIPQLAEWLGRRIMAADE